MHDAVLVRRELKREEYQYFAFCSCGSYRRGNTEEEALNNLDDHIVQEKRKAAKHRAA